MSTHEAVGRTRSRQRRIAEQSARITSARRVQRRQQALRGGGVALVAGAASLFLSRPATPTQDQPVPIEGSRQQVDQGTDLPYRNRPPSSGDHYRTPAGYGVFTREIPAGNLVHALEHGGVVVYYRPDLCEPACLGQLQQAYNDAPRSRARGWGHEIDQPIHRASAPSTRPTSTMGPRTRSRRAPAGQGDGRHD